MEQSSGDLSAPVGVQADTGRTRFSKHASFLNIRGIGWSRNKNCVAAYLASPLYIASFSPVELATLASHLRQSLAVNTEACCRTAFEYIEYKFDCAPFQNKCGFSTALMTITIQGTAGDQLPVWSAEGQKRTALESCAATTKTKEGVA